MQIADKVFVVTGGANGMGREVALGLLDRGAQSAVVDIDERALADFAQTLDNGPARVTTYQADITDRDAVAVLHERILAAHGQIDGLVNIAGIIHRFAPFVELSAADADRIIAVNFSGTVNMCREFLPTLLTRPEANITNMSSLSALLPFATQTLYSASKGAVKQFSEGLHAELCDTNVHVVTVFPGNVSTDLTGHSGVDMIDAGDRKVRSTTPKAAGARIVDGIARDRFRVLIGADAHALNVFATLAPGRATRFVARQIEGVL